MTSYFDRGTLEELENRRNNQICGSKRVFTLQRLFTSEWWTFSTSPVKCQLFLSGKFALLLLPFTQRVRCWRPCLALPAVSKKMIALYYKKAELLQALDRSFHCAWFFTFWWLPVAEKSLQWYDTSYFKTIKYEILMRLEVFCGCSDCCLH
jgi:hypothetical protein